MFVMNQTAVFISSCKPARASIEAACSWRESLRTQCRKTYAVMRITQLSSATRTAEVGIEENRSQALKPTRKSRKIVAARLILRERSSASLRRWTCFKNSMTIARSDTGFVVGAVIKGVNELEHMTLRR